MRTSSLLLALPALATAQQIALVDQLKGWFAKASSSISSAIPSVPSSVPIPDPIASGAAKIVSAKVETITIENHNAVLQPGAATASPGLEEWMIFITGGNKTCYGLCGHSEKAWNEAVALLAASPSPPHLGMLDCETQSVLCHAWFVAPPLVMHILLPQPLPDQSSPATTVRYISVNETAVTVPEIAAIHLQEKYKETAPYDGFLHPFDGPLAKLGLAIPIGYFIWGFSKIPSWAFMIGVSMLSRQFMSRNMARQQPRGAGTGAQ